MLKTAAVVVTYNRKELLGKCLRALLSQTVGCDIYVVDNDSSDGTGEMITTEFARPEVKYINSGANLGGAGGFQLGMERAVRDGYRYIWVMDDDTIPRHDSLEKLFRGGHALKGQWGALSSVAEWTDGNICRANRQKKTIFTFASDRELRQKEPVRCEMISFVSMLIRASAVKRLGLPKGEYFIWSDDYEYSGRISKHYPIYVITDSVVTHAMKENKKADFAVESPERIDRYHLLYRNDVDCYRQFGLRGWVYVILKDIIACMNVLLRSENDSFRKIGVIYKGFREGLGFCPEVKRV